MMVSLGINHCLVWQPFSVLHVHHVCTVDRNTSSKVVLTALSCQPHIYSVCLSILLFCMQSVVITAIWFH